MFMEQKGRFWSPLAVDYGYYAPLQAGSIDGTDTIPHDRAVVRAMSAKCEYRNVPIHVPTTSCPSFQISQASRRKEAQSQLCLWPESVTAQRKVLTHKQFTHIVSRIAPLKKIT